MPRTRQTSRKFTGGKAHRRQLATKAPRRSYSSNDDSSNEGQNLLVSIYNSTHTRTIAVDGEDSFDVIPDEVKLVFSGFKIIEESRDFQEAMQSALTALNRVRPKIISLGIGNDKITSDSLSMDERVVVMRDGVQINNNDDDDEEEDEEGKKNK